MSQADFLFQNLLDDKLPGEQQTPTASQSLVCMRKM